MKHAPADDDRKELEKALRKSRRSLPINVGYSVLAVALLWAADEFAGLPSWAVYTLGFFGVFGTVGDAINIPYVTYRLKKLDAAK